MQQLSLPITKPYRIKIERDDHGESPREWGNLGTMVCWHDRYTLGDEQPDVDPTEHRAGMAEDLVPGLMERMENITGKMAALITGPAFTREWRERWQEITNYSGAVVDAVLDKHYIMLPLYLYDHSGITMSTGSFGCPWDSGQVGFIYVSIEKVKKEYGWKRMSAKRTKQIASYLEGEVKTYDAYLTGDIYGYVVEEFEAGEWEEADACGGFYGYDDAVEGVFDHVSSYGLTKDDVGNARADMGQWVTIGVSDADA